MRYSTVSHFLSSFAFIPSFSSAQVTTYNVLTDPSCSTAVSIIESCGTKLTGFRDRSHLSRIQLSLCRCGTARNRAYFGYPAKSTEVVDLLLQNGTYIDSKDKYDQTPLLLTANSQRTKFIKLLLQNSAEIESKNDSNQILLCAIENEHIAIIGLLPRRDSEVEF
jgi:hypothetical protein